MHYQPCVYILASRSRRLYVGVTTNRQRRWFEHSAGITRGFTTKYNINRLVYVETTPHIRDAIVREKQLKPWRREKKIALIEAANPTWEDLAVVWGWREKQIPPLAPEGARSG
jgi:putative endonuclease